jgi:D-alanine-D-alanine ligase
MDKNLTIAFLYNVRHHYPDVNDPQIQLETDFDDPKTVKWIIKHLTKCTRKVFPIEADEKAYLKLYRNKAKIDLAFNYSMGKYGKSGYAQLPAILEMLQIPYSGSQPLTETLVMRKDKAKEILLTHQIPTLTYQLFHYPQEKLKKELSFPLIVKPSARGSSAGITNASVVYHKKALEKQLAFVIETFKDPALVEPFLSGREFSVGMLGNPPRILPIIESDHTVLPKKYLPLDSLEVKWHFEEESGGKNFICPAKISQNLKTKIEDTCFKTWQALEVNDFCRIDIRCDQKENPYVLEVNSPPGLIPPEVSMTSYLPLAARAAGIDYDQLLTLIITHALKRYHKK